MDLSTSDFEIEYYESLYDKGIKRLNSQKNEIRRKLDEYIRPDGVVDGGALEGDWFPNIEAHLFLSHSHSDERLAIVVSQWLFDNFGIKTFIDSCVWGYCGDLLRELDNKYALRGDFYDYDIRNRTSGFVHMMLATALTKMIDRCECLFFLNTPNSIVPDPGKSETSSPWIYYELFQSLIIRKLQRKPEQRSFSAGGKLNENAFRIAMPAYKAHLYPLNVDILNNWQSQAQYSPEKDLDTLYHLTQTSQFND